MLSVLLCNQHCCNRATPNKSPHVVLVWFLGVFHCCSQLVLPPPFLLSPAPRAGVWGTGFGGVWRPCMSRGSRWHQRPGPPRGRYQGRDAGTSSCPECPRQAGVHLAPSPMHKAEYQGSLSVSECYLSL